MALFPLVYLVVMLASVVVIGVVAAVVIASVRRGRPDSLPSAAPLDVRTVESISQLVRRDNRIEAVKVLRAATGMGLAQAHRRVVGWSDVMELQAAQQQTGQQQAGHLRGDERLKVEASAVLAASGWHTAETFLREQRGLTSETAKSLLDSLG